MVVNRLFHKLSNVIPAYRDYKRLYENWYIALLDYLKLSRKGEVVYKLRNGIMLKATKGSFDKSIIKEIWLDKNYNPPGFEIGKKDIVIDIGAHKGFFSIFAAVQAREGEVYSFEPSSYNFKFLVENIKINNLSNIKAFNLGVCEKRGMKRLFMSNESATYSIYGNNKKYYEDIRCITLEDIFTNHRIEKCDFLKMDCEGVEYEILFNTPKDIIHKIDKISLEAHITPEYKPDDIKNFLIHNKFRVYEITIENPPKVEIPGVKMIYGKK